MQAPADGAPALFESILAHLHRTVVALSESSRHVELGWVAKTPSLPRVHTLNQVHVGAPASVDEALDLVRGEQEHLPYRHLRVSDARTAEALVGALRAGAGWRIERDVLMALGEPPDRRAQTGPVAELSEDEMLLLKRRWTIEDHLDTEEGVLDQLDEYNRREGRLWHEQVFGVRDERGVPLAVTKLRAEGGVGWVEDVYTVPEARGRGYARALVTFVTDRARAAGHDLVFIVADDEDWPKNLYFDIGFRPVGKVWAFHHEEVA